MDWSITAVPYRAKARPLRPRRSYFGPADAALNAAALVEPPGTAPGSDRFITTPVYRHSHPCGWQAQYRGREVKKKGFASSCFAQAGRADPPERRGTAGQ